MHKNITLSLKNITFAFRENESHFFDNVTIDFTQSTINFIHGKNGIGKSTLFRLLQGVFSSSEKVIGNVICNGTNYNLARMQAGFEKINDMCAVQQNIDLMLADQFSFIENIRLASMKKYPFLALLPQKKQLPEFIDRFGIDMFKSVRYLSGGQRQILAIMMVLQKPCSVLLLDEPTAALDEQNSILVMDFLHELIQRMKITILMICHDVDLIKRYKGNEYLMRVDNQGFRVLNLIS